MTRHRRLPLLLLAACLSQPAMAQINPLRSGNSKPLDAADLAAANAATMHLLERTTLVAGALEHWKNPQSAASGTVVAGAAITRKGMACRVMQYRTTVPGSTLPERHNTLTWCKTKEGWKVAS